MRTLCYLLRSVRQRVLRAAASSRLSEASKVSLGCLAAGHQNDARQVWPFHMADSIPDWSVLHSNQNKFSLFLRRKHIPVTLWQLQLVQFPGIPSLSSLSWIVSLVLGIP